MTPSPSRWDQLASPRVWLDLFLLLVIVLALLRVLNLAGRGQLQPYPVALALAGIAAKLLIDAICPFPGKN